jgi:uncharacterized protein YjiS (DUF1127 family)
MAQLHIALPFRPRSGIFARVMQVVATIATRRRDRARLGQLDAHMLRDIGIEAQDARAECDKPFWKA